MVAFRLLLMLTATETAAPTLGEVAFTMPKIVEPDTKSRKISQRMKKYLDEFT